MIALVRSLLAILAAAAMLAWPAQAADPDALWRVVHDLCVPDLKTTGRPAPCLKVDLADGWAVLHDIRGGNQLLLVPTAKVTGIEDPALLAPRAPNYWRDAWEARALFEARVGRPVPRQDIALAVNSIDGRSQNQLHIHIDCVRDDVRHFIASHWRRIGRTWSPRRWSLAGEDYRAMRLDGPTLDARDPFRLLARGWPKARAEMGAWTLVLVGAQFGSQPGFVLLADRADPLRFDIGAGEQLMDHHCAVLNGGRL